YFVASPNFFEALIPNGITEEMTAQISKLQIQGKTVMMLGTENEILGWIAVADQVRETTKGVVQKLHQLGIEKTVMLTGDNQKTAMAIGKDVGVSNVEADLLPEDKLNFIN